MYLLELIKKISKVQVKNICKGALNFDQWKTFFKANKSLIMACLQLYRE